MRVVFLSILSLLLCANTFAQNPGPDISWQKCFSTSGTDCFTGITALEDEGYLACMYFQKKDNFLSGDTASGSYLVKFDNNFNVLWKRFIPLYATKVIISNDNSIILGGIIQRSWDKGNIFSNIHGTDLYTTDVGVMKLDSSGQNIIWAKAYGSTAEESALYDFKKSNDGGFILTTDTRGCDGDIPICNRPCYTPFYRDAVIFKIDSLGTLAWLKLYSGSGDEITQGSIVALDNNKYYISIGSSSSDCDFSGTTPFDPNKENFRRLLIVIDEEGHEIQRKIDDSGRQTRFEIKSWTNGNKIFAIGQSSAKISYSPTYPKHDNWDASIIVYDDSLNVLFQKLFGGIGYEIFIDHIYDKSGNHIFLSKTSSSDNSGDINNYKGGDWDHWLVKTDTSFNIIWSRTVGSIGKDTELFGESWTELIINNDQLIVASHIFPPENLPNKDIECGLFSTNGGIPFYQYSDAWLAAFDLSTGIEVLPTNEPSPFKLYPNPSSSIITIQNNTPTGKRYKIKITDEQGKLIKEIDYEDVKEYSLPINDLADGMYYLNIYKNRKSLFLQKMIVRK